MTILDFTLMIMTIKVKTIQNSRQTNSYLELCYSFNKKKIMSHSFTGKAATDTASIYYITNRSLCWFCCENIIIYYY